MMLKLLITIPQLNKKNREVERGKNFTGQLSSQWALRNFTHAILEDCR